jgi:hypothetical protein
MCFVDCKVCRLTFWLLLFFCFFVSPGQSYFLAVIADVEGVWCVPNRGYHPCVALIGSNYVSVECSVPLLAYVAESYVWCPPLDIVGRCCISYYLVCTTCPSW